jgi:hypothetical protein
MAFDHGLPRAVVVAVVGDRELPIGIIHRATRCDLTLIDDLARLRLVAARLGWTIRLTQVDRDLGELVELVGLGECLGLRPRTTVR